MIRLIKMELYRLFHAVSTYVMLLVVVGVVVLSTFAIKMDLRMMEKEQGVSGTGQTQQETAGNGSGAGEETPVESFGAGFTAGFMESGEEDFDEEGFTFGIQSSVDESWIDGDIDAGEMLMSELNSCLLVVFIAIFVPLFVNAEQKKGYIKNIAGQIPRRGMLALSKLPAVAIQVFLLFAMFCAAQFAAGAIFFRERLVFTDAGAFMGALGMQYVLHVAWGCLIALFTMAARSTAFAMTTGILLASGIFELAARYLNRAVHALIPSAGSFDIMRVTLSYATGNMTKGSMAGQAGGFMALAVVYILISAVVSGVIYHKRDVR